jgi:hypothetical protein
MARLRIEHALVHVHVDYLRTVGHLLARDVDGGGIVVGFDQLTEFRGAGDIGALAHIDEQTVRIDIERFESAQATRTRDDRNDSRGDAGHGPRDRTDVIRRRAAAPAQHIQETAGCELAQYFRRFLGCFIVFPESVRQPSVWIGTDVGIGNPREFLDIGSQLFAAECAVEPHGGRSRMANRVPKRFGGLAGQGASGCIGNRARHDDGQIPANFIENLPYRVERGLRIQRIEHRLDQDQVDSTRDERSRRGRITVDQFVERDITKTRIVDIG